MFTEPWRKKRPYGDTEGDAHKGWPADPKAYWLYFLDDGVYGQEEVGGEPGFWLRGRGPAEVVLRALEPVARAKVTVIGGPVDDDLTVSVDGRSQQLTLRPGETRELVFEPGPGFVYYDSFLYVMRFYSRRAGPDPDRPARTLSAFVKVALEVNKRPRAD